MMARVASRGESHAVIVIAGMPVTAQVPPEVQAGSDAQAQGQEVTPERVMLQIDPQTQPRRLAAGAGAHGARGRSWPVEEPPTRRRGADGEPADVVSLTFTSPTLGKLDLRLSCAESAYWPK